MGELQWSPRNSHRAHSFYHSRLRWIWQPQWRGKRQQQTTDVEQIPFGCAEGVWLWQPPWPGFRLMFLWYMWSSVMCPEVSACSFSHPGNIPGFCSLTQKEKACPAAPSGQWKLELKEFVFFSNSRAPLPQSKMTLQSRGNKCHKSEASSPGDFPILLLC